MILAKFGQKLLAVENSAGIALGCIEADFLRFESSGIARRCAQPLPQHHFAILNKSAKIIFAYICLFHNRITFLAFSDRVFNFSPRRFIVEYSRCLSVCVCRESGVVLRLARSGGCSIRAGGVGQKAYRLKIQDSKTQKLMTQLSTDCAMTSHPLLTALLLIRFVQCRQTKCLHCFHSKKLHTQRLAICVEITFSWPEHLKRYRL